MEKNKTVLTELLEWSNAESEYVDDNGTFVSFYNLREKIKELLIREKEQVFDAYNAGTKFILTPIGNTHISEKLFNNPNDYFEKTYQE